MALARVQASVIARCYARAAPLTMIYQSDITFVGDRVADTTETGGIPMDAPDNGKRGWRDVMLDYTPFRNASKGLRGWWLSPPRSGIYRLLPPWEYRHLRFFGSVRIAGGTVAAAAGLICLAYGVYAWAAFFLVIAALNFAGGGWFLTVARSASPRT
jgi:hypothetical protein